MEIVPISERDQPTPYFSKRRAGPQKIFARRQRFWASIVQHSTRYSTTFIAINSQTLHYKIVIHPNGHDVHCCFVISFTIHHCNGPCCVLDPEGVAAQINVDIGDACIYNGSPSPGPTNQLAICRLCGASLFIALLRSIGQGGAWHSLLLLICLIDPEKANLLFLPS